MGRGRRPGEAQAGQPRGSLSGSEAAGQSRCCFRPKVVSYSQPMLLFNIHKVSFSNDPQSLNRVLNKFSTILEGSREPWLTADAKEHGAKGYFWARVPLEPIGLG